MDNQFLTEKNQNKINEARNSLIKAGYKEVVPHLDHYIQREYEFYLQYVQKSGTDFERREGLVAEYNSNVPVYIESKCSGLI